MAPRRPSGLPEGCRALRGATKGWPVASRIARLTKPHATSSNGASGPHHRQGVRDLRWAARPLVLVFLSTMLSSAAVNAASIQNICFSSGQLVPGQRYTREEQTFTKGENPAQP